MSELNDAASEQELAAEVAASADLVNVRLVKSVVEAKTLPEPGTLHYRLKQDPTVEVLAPPHFSVDISYELDVHTADGESDGAQIEIAFTYSVLYEIPEQKLSLLDNDAALQAFANTVGMMMLFPYAREYVADATTRISLPALHLPPVRLPSPWHSD